MGFGGIALGFGFPVVLGLAAGLALEFDFAVTLASGLALLTDFFLTSGSGLGFGFTSSMELAMSDISFLMSDSPMSLPASLTTSFKDCNSFCCASNNSRSSSAFNSLSTSARTSIMKLRNLAKYLPAVRATPGSRSGPITTSQSYSKIEFQGQTCGQV